MSLILLELLFFFFRLAAKLIGPKSVAASNAYSLASFAPLPLSSDGIVSVAASNAYSLTSSAPLSLSSDGIVGVAASNAYSLTSSAPLSLSLLMVLWVLRRPTLTVSPALDSLSFSLDDHWMVIYI